MNDNLVSCTACGLVYHGLHAHSHPEYWCICGNNKKADMIPLRMSADDKEGQGESPHISD